MVTMEEVEAELAEGDVLEDAESDGGSEESEELLSELRPMDAMQLRTEELIAEMERRHLHPKGFLTDDAKELQRYFDKEYEQDLEKIKAEKRDERRREREKARLHKKKIQLEKQLKDEEEAIASDRQTRTWLRLIHDNLTHDTARIVCDSITVRPIAKALWTNSSLTALDLCRNKLSDFAGAQVARILKRNRHMVKLELNENFLGTRTCASFAEWLCHNETLKTLELESNSLRGGGGDGILSMANALKSSSLTALSLFRCDCGKEAGTQIARALEDNTKLTSLDICYNGFHQDSLIDIADSLDRNRDLYEARLAEEEERRSAEEAKNKETREQEEVIERKKTLDRWMDDQRDQRALERIEAVESEREKRQAELNHQRQLQEQALRDEKRLKEEAAKKKKKKKKKK